MWAALAQHGLNCASRLLVLQTCLAGNVAQRSTWMVTAHMCDTSNTHACVRHHFADSIRESLYCIGISQPAKGTIFPAHCPLCSATECLTRALETVRSWREAKVEGQDKQLVLQFVHYSCRQRMQSSPGMQAVAAVTFLNVLDEKCYKLSQCSRSQERAVSTKLSAMLQGCICVRVQEHSLSPSVHTIGLRYPLQALRSHSMFRMVTHLLAQRESRRAECA